MTGKQATVYCDMTGASTGCGGGGWTMVMRINGQQVRKYISITQDVPKKVLSIEISSCC
jgi:hypothetical protein